LPPSNGAADQRPWVEPPIDPPGRRSLLLGRDDPELIGPDPASPRRIPAGVIRCSRDRQGWLKYNTPFCVNIVARAYRSIGRLRSQRNPPRRGNLGNLETASIATSAANLPIPTRLVRSLSVWSPRLERVVLELHGIRVARRLKGVGIVCASGGTFPAPMFDRR
jgi:hypothetical protein